MSQPRWLDERETHTWRAFLDLRRRIEAAIDLQLTRDSGLSSVDYELLVPLSESPDGVLRARDLGRMVGWERSRVRTVDPERYVNLCGPVGWVGLVSGGPRRLSSLW